MGNGVLHVYYKYDMCKCNVNPIRSQLEHNGIIDRFHFNVLIYFLDKTVNTKAHANNTMYII